MTEDTHPHPWTVPREDDDDGPPDVGDPRDMAVPSVRRGGMTVASGSDWAALVASLGDLKDDTPMRRATRDDYQHADAFAQAVEGAMRLDPRLTPEEHFDVAGGALQNTMRVAALKANWIYGPRFWAWWQARQAKLEGASTGSPYEALTRALIAGTAPTLAPFGDPDPRPILTLADGSSVRADEVWHASEPHDSASAYANAGGIAYWQRRTDGEWLPSVSPYWPWDRGTAGRTYPPAAAKPEPHPANAHLMPGDEIRTADGWHTVIEEAHPAYPHVRVETEDGGGASWFRAAILETRKAKAKSAPAVNAHGVDDAGGRK